MAKVNLIERLKDACEYDGEISFRDDYSGRGMYGKECVGISGGYSACQRLIAEVIIQIGQGMQAANDGDPDFDEFEEAVRKLMNFASDSMGSDVILYFPRIKVEVAEAE